VCVRELLAELSTALDRRVPCVYCAVVATRGSTPQKAGAAMLAFPDGTQAGTLGGGCVEAEVKRRALHALAAGEGPAVFSFNLDDDYGWDDGLICGGRMTILAHPLSSVAGVSDPGPASLRPATEYAATYYRHLRSLADGGEGFTEAVVLADNAGSPIGDRYLFDAAAARVAHLASPPAWDAVAANLTPLINRPQPSVRGGIAYLPALPRITLLLVGGGHVAQALARLAADVEFDVWVLDDRSKFASRERFPTANRLIVGDIGPTLRDLAPTLTPSTYSLIMTRGHNHDEEALSHLAETACGYVGMIGSKRKIRLIFDDLIARGVSHEALNRVHAPLGFDIGSQTVPEIAVSIVAELIARRNTGTTDLPRRTWAARDNPA
jgi:xanthine dehydrogenase accessory factor